MVAARTTTAVTWMDPPRAMYKVGATVREFQYTEAQFHATVSSCILLAKLPAHCLILDYFIAGAASGNTSGSLQVEAGANILGGSFSVAAIATPLRLAGPGIKISLSDDAATQYAAFRLMCTTASTASVTLSLTGWISYIVGSKEA